MIRRIVVTCDRCAKEGRVDEGRSNSGLPTGWGSIYFHRTLLPNTGGRYVTSDTFRLVDYGESTNTMDASAYFCDDCMTGALGLISGYVKSAAKAATAITDEAAKLKYEYQWLADEAQMMKEVIKVLGAGIDASDPTIKADSKANVLARYRIFCEEQTKRRAAEDAKSKS